MQKSGISANNNSSSGKIFVQTNEYDFKIGRPYVGPQIEKSVRTKNKQTWMNLKET